MEVKAQDGPGGRPELPEPARRPVAAWPEPFPDVLLGELPEAEPGPGTRYGRKESVSLAFIAATQLLPPRQRAALVLHDVLGFPAREAADILGTTESSVTSALKRARAALDHAVRASPAAAPAASARERELAGRYAEAFENGDVDAIVSALTGDAWLRMPPLPVEYRGRERVAAFLRTIAFHPAARYRMIATRANGQPAFAMYQYDEHAPIARAHGLDVLSVTDDGIAAITRFLDTGLFRLFGLPRTLREEPPRRSPGSAPGQS